MEIFHFVCARFEIPHQRDDGRLYSHKHLSFHFQLTQNIDRLNRWTDGQIDSFIQPNGQTCLYSSPPNQDMKIKSLIHTPETLDHDHWQSSQMAVLSPVVAIVTVKVVSHLNLSKMRPSHKRGKDARYIAVKQPTSHPVCLLASPLRS